MTGQFRLAGHPGPYQLKVHEVVAGRPRCGTWVDWFQGRRMELAQWDGHDTEVTCDRCLAGVGPHVS